MSVLQILVKMELRASTNIRATNVTVPLDITEHYAKLVCYFCVEKIKLSYQTLLPRLKHDILPRTMTQKMFLLQVVISSFA